MSSQLTGKSSAKVDSPARPYTSAFTRLPSWLDGLRFIVILFVTTRTLLTVIGVYSRQFLEPFHGQHYYWVYSRHLWLDIWGVWDTGWFLEIAQSGYSTALSADPIKLNQANYCFFPLYPLLMRLFAPHYYVGGLLIANFCLMAGSLLLYRLVLLESNRETALRSVKYFYLMPAGFVLSAGFSESLFVALALACFYFARRPEPKWWLVGLSGFFLCLTRPNGIIALFPLGFEYLRHCHFQFRRIRSNVLWLMLLPAGIGAYSAYCHRLTGDWLAYVHVRATGWKHAYQNPFNLIIDNLFSRGPEDQVNAVFTVILIGVIVWAWRRFPFAYWSWAALNLAVLLVNGQAVMNSMFRYAIVIFPLAILLGGLCENRRRDELMSVGLALIQAFLMVFWANGFHVIV
ncbi:MAG: mannosyltransferase family protein [Acidobacteriota bacterium]